MTKGNHIISKFFFISIVFIFLLLVSFTKSWGQTTIFSENIGNVNSGTQSIAATTFQNNGTLTYVGTADTRTTAASSGYSSPCGAASGVRNVFFTNSGTATFEISGINTSACTNFTLSYGLFKSTIASNGSEFTISVSTDGISYTPLSTPSLPTGSGTANWYLRSITSGIPSTANLRIKFVNTSTTPQFRLDDLCLQGDCGGGTPHTVTFDANGGAGSMSNQIANSATNLTANAFTNSGCTFVNWNDSANANGTSYSNSAVYSFTADVTLYAQWNCASGGGSTGCPYIVSAVVNACGGSCGAEGKNELVVMNSGNYAIPVNGTNINLYYSGGTNHYFTNSFAASSGTVVSNLNTLTATSGCTNTPFIFVPSGGTIPANSTFMILNNNSCFNGSFSAYCNAGPIYVIISTDADWSSGGYFGNNNTSRYFRTDFSSVNSGCGVTTYNYNNPSAFSFGTDGAAVAFSGTTPSYIVGNGSCAPNIAILPIELLDFYATKNGKGNEVTWKVAQEENIISYTIEKSKDALEFTKFAAIYANNETHTKSYSVFDNEPYNDITYYRLSTKETDGTIKNYKIISIDEKDNKWEYIHYQTENNLVIEFKNSLPKSTIASLYDINGKDLITQTIKQSQTIFNLETLTAGIYFVSLSTPIKTEHFKIIISK